MQLVEEVDVQLGDKRFVICVTCKLARREKAFTHNLYNKRLETLFDGEGHSCGVERVQNAPALLVGRHTHGMWAACKRRVLGNKQIDGGAQLCFELGARLVQKIANAREEGTRRDEVGNGLDLEWGAAGAQGMVQRQGHGEIGAPLGVGGCHIY